MWSALHGFLASSDRRAGHRAPVRGRQRAVRRRGATRLLAICASGFLVVGCKSELDIGGAPSTDVVLVTVHPDVDLDAGLDGTFAETMGTAFASAPWQSSLFDKYPNAAAAASALGAQHALVQIYDSPLTAGAPDGGAWDYRRGTWSFTELDQIVQPLLRMQDAGGPEPVLQIYPPTWYSSDPDAGADFAEYCAAIVRYYNADGGLPLADGGALRSDGGPIRSWAIWNDPNLNQFVPSSLDLPVGFEFATLYRSAASAMLAVDPGLRILGPELNDCPNLEMGLSAACDQTNFLPGFLAGLSDGGTTAPLGVLSLHMFPLQYATLYPDASPPNGPISDDMVLSTVSMFVTDLTNARQSLVDNGLGATPVWVTASQVNADVPTDAGDSLNTYYYTGNLTPYQADARGTGPFIAAWRPYMFSRLARAGNQALFQWQFTGGQCPTPTSGCSYSAASDTDPQNAEFDYVTHSTNLTYWVDWALAHKFRVGSQILDVSAPAVPDDAIYSSYSTSTPIVDVLATKDANDPVYTVMVVNLARRASNAASVVDGAGSPITVIVDVSQIVGSAPSGWKASELMVDGFTDTTHGPQEQGGLAVNALVAPNGHFALPPISFKGYGAVFITLCGPSVATCPPTVR